MCAHVRGGKPALPPEHSAAVSGEVNPLFDFLLHLSQVACTNPPALSAL